MGDEPEQKLEPLQPSPLERMLADLREMRCYRHPWSKKGYVYTGVSSGGTREGWATLNFQCLECLIDGRREAEKRAGDALATAEKEAQRIAELRALVANAEPIPETIRAEK